jgi:hypothetical protein
MERCETCGNAYERTFKIHMNGKDHTFDCFECAIQALAPHCNNCGTRIIGHGLESGLDFFCCAGCARMHGVTDLVDHTDYPASI